MSTRVTSKGQVTIPQYIRDVAGIDAGTALNWSYDPATRQVVATKFEAAVDDVLLRVDSIIGSATTRMSTDEIMALTRDWPEE